MKIIGTNGIYGLTVSTNETEYPASNLLDIYTQRLWKSTESTSTITITTDSAVSGLYLGNTNAEAYTIEIKSIGGSTVYETHTGQISGGRLFFEFDSSYQLLNVEIEIQLMTPGPEGGNVYAGILRCGDFITLPDPQYGLKTQREDFSIKESLSNGGLYVNKRYTPRAFELSLLMTYPEFESLDEIYDAIGSNPLAMLLAEDIDNDDFWSGFFHIMESPTGSYSFYNMVDCSLQLREAV